MKLYKEIKTALKQAIEHEKGNCKANESKMSLKKHKKKKQERHR